jgi:hypothetical protein
MAAPIDALEELMAWLERDDSDEAVMFCDELRALCRRGDLQPAQMRLRLVELLRHMMHALDQVI